MKDSTPRLSSDKPSQRMRRTLTSGVKQTLHASADALFFVRLFARACKPQLAV